MAGWDRWARVPDPPKDRRGSPSLWVPEVGDEVRIVRGEHAGAVFRVTAVSGNAFSLEQQVFVDADPEIPVWYYAWDVAKT